MSMLKIEQENGKHYIIDVNPATLEVIDKVPLESEEEVARKVERARVAFENWSQLDFEDRAEIISKAGQIMLDEIDVIADLITTEQGKPLIEAITADIMVAADLIFLYTKRGKKLIQEYEIPLHLFRFVKKSIIVPRPLGVVAVISPWNYPFAIPMSGIIFALLAGNTVVFKPASDTPLIGLKIKEIFDKAGLPQGVLEVAITRGAVAERVLCSNPIRKVIFTGSTEVGKRIIKKCAENIIPVVAELGGKDPMIVLDDADIDMASSGAVWGAFTNAGQVCASVERLYVHKKIAKEFIDAVVEKTKKIRVGNGKDPNTDMGPLVNESQLKTVSEHVLEAVQKGARVLTGGTRREDMNGYFYEPTVLVDVNHSMLCMKEETFGPTLPIMVFETEEEAIRLANDTKYGLTASVWTSDLKRGEKIAKKIEAGSVLVNDHAMSYGLIETPWQGMKESGIGRSHSDEGFKEFLYPQHINIEQVKIKNKPWAYPYSKEKYELFASLQQLVFKKGVVPKFSEIYKLFSELRNNKNFREMLKNLIK
jgi:succinate-semialdehyde dehydrogenase/glutarate-semialdehyde dehydrogenase